MDPDGGSDAVPFQRDAAANPDAERARLCETRALLVDASGASCIVALGAHSEALRALGEVEEASIAAAIAIDRARSLGDDRREAANTVRLATALQYAGRHDEALELFNAGIARTEPGFREYRHFLLQHMGKCLVEMGSQDDARRAFEAALTLRIELGDESLLRSTARAIAGIAGRP